MQKYRRKGLLQGTRALAAQMKRFFPSAPRDWLIAFFSTLIPLAFAIYYSMKSQSLSEEVTLNELVRSVPSLTYSWASNYRWYAYYPRDMSMTVRAQKLRSRFRVTNVSGENLQQFSLSFFCSFDEQLFFNADKPTKARSIGTLNLDEHDGQFKQDNIIDIDVFDCLRRIGVDPLILLPGQDSLYLTARNRFEGTSVLGDMVIADPTFVTHVVPTMPMAIKGLYFRVAITYLSKGIMYKHILLGIVGIGFPTTTAISQVMYSYDFFYKERNTYIRLPSESKVVDLNQFVHTSDEFIDQLRYPGDLYNEITAFGGPKLFRAGEWLTELQQQHSFLEYRSSAKSAAYVAIQSDR